MIASHRERLELFIRCFICNKALSEPVFNRDHQDYDPCDECKQVIEDTLAGFRDKPSAEEDDFPEEPLDDFLDKEDNRLIANDNYELA